jgi:hypothetical protein
MFLALMCIGVFLIFCGVGVMCCCVVSGRCAEQERIEELKRRISK